MFRFSQLFLACCRQNKHIFEIGEQKISKLPVLYFHYIQFLIKCYKKDDLQKQVILIFYFIAALFMTKLRMYSAFC